MGTIRARCTGCARVVAVQPERAVFAIPEGTQGRSQAELLFLCPGCGAAGLWYLPRPLAAVWVRCGAAVVPRLQDPPEREPHPEQHPEHLAPLSPDDLLTLHELLASPRWLAELTDGEASTDGGGPS